MFSKTTLARILTAVVLLASTLHAQTVTGAISGAVVDTSGLAVPGAKVSMVNDATAVKYQAQSTAGGDFLFSAVAPGTYTLAVEHPGFKKFVKHDLILTESDRLSAGRLVLEVGSVTESVTVRAMGTEVDVESTDRYQLVSGDEMNLQIRGRNYLDLTNILPGAIGDERWFNLESPQSSITPNFSGISNSSNSVFVDGANASSLINPNWSTTNVPLDSVGEIKVSIANYRAEDGRNGSAVIKSYTKSGTKQLHGSVYDYERNQFFNANYFFNNLNGLARPVYRYHTFGGSLGGPIPLGRLNPHREKLFFFVSTEASPTQLPQSLVQVTVPTALERSGDFSQTVDQNGKAVSIQDPNNNKTPFPGNVIPQSRISAVGQALLNLFPLPNFLNRTISKGNYNYNFMESRDHVTLSTIVKIDYNITSKFRVFFRGGLWREDDEDYYQAGQNWNMFRVHYHERFDTGAFNATYIVSPTIVYELTIGARGTPNWYSPANQPLSAIQKSTLGLNLAQFYPQDNPNNILPSMTFGGVPGAAAWGGSNLLTLGSKWDEPEISISQGVTKIFRSHSFKAGTYTERNRYTNAIAGNYAGAISFSNDSNNPYNTNWAYSNAILGSYDTYSETTPLIYDDLRGLSMEWYVQDTWKASRRLTLDYGMRFTWFEPYKQANNKALNFIPSLYNPQQAVKLYYPYTSSLAINPLTGATYPAAYAGAVIPGSGNPLDGMVAQTSSGFIQNRGVEYGPRIGFAYALTGDGKTVMRGGFGVSYSPFASQSPMAVVTGTVQNTQSTSENLYGTLATLQTISGISFPGAAFYLPEKQKNPEFYSDSFGIQRSVGFGTVVDVAYVGTMGRYIGLRDTNYNTLPFGTRFQPWALNPYTKATLADNYLRPYVGYAGITTLGFTNSHYNSLQTQVRRRFAKGMSFGGNWTWSKAMGYIEPYAQYYNNSLNYAKLSIDRTHVVNLDYTYDLPKATTLWNVAPVKWAFNNWQWSGITSFASGRPWMVTYSMSSGPDIVGGGDYNRPLMVGNPELPWSARTINEFFNVNAFAAPPQIKGTFPGNEPNDAVRGPGRNNWDMTFTKKFPIWEHKDLTLRWEIYNIFNHPSFYQMNVTARYDPTTYQQINAGFGQLTNTLTPRTMQFALRLVF